MLQVMGGLRLRMLFRRKPRELFRRHGATIILVRRFRVLRAALSVTLDQQDFVSPSRPRPYPFVIRCSLSEMRLVLKLLSFLFVC